MTDTVVYYHVIGDQYQDGDDLLTRDALEQRGIVYGTRPWDDDTDGEIIDSDIICLYETLAEARDHLDSFGGAGIVSVTLDVEDGHALYPDREVRIDRNGEGYACVYQPIPARYIARIDRLVEAL